jgi:hypothetical protein
LRAVRARLERAVARLGGHQDALLTRLDELGRLGRVQSRTALRRGNG